MTDSNPIRVQCRDLSIGYLCDRPVLKGLNAEDTQMPHGWRCDWILTLAATDAGSGSDVANAVRLAGVDYATNIPVRTLSKGMRHRLALSDSVLLVDQGSGRLVEPPEGEFTRDFPEGEFLGFAVAAS